MTEYDVAHLTFLLQESNRQLEKARGEILDLKDRLNIVSGDTVCSKCHKDFDTAVKLKAHQAKDMPCDFICKKCNQKCYNRHKYYRHMKSHTQL